MEYDPEDPDKFVYDTSNFHIYNPACSPLVLEFVVMNNKNDKASEKHLNNVYDVVKKMVLENADDEDKITEYNDENEEYTSGPMNNFDEVNYTSPLKLIDDFVINGDYFNVYDPNNPDDGGYTQKQVDLFKEIYTELNLNYPINTSHGRKLSTSIYLAGIVIFIKPFNSLYGITTSGEPAA